MSTFIDEATWRNNLFTSGWVPAAQSAEVIEPATGKVISRIGLAGVDDVGKAAQVATAARIHWVAMEQNARAAVFLRAAALMEEHIDQLSSWIIRESGSIRAKAEVEIKASIGNLLEAAAMVSQPTGLLLPSPTGQMSFARRIPHGVVGIIAPFNFPLILAMRAVAPALAAGNSVILKPDTRTAISGGFLIARILEAAGLPSGCLHVLPGDANVGRAVVTDPLIAMISFTGSTGAGRQVGELAGRYLKKVTLELGGKNSLIVLDDADIDVAASNAAWGSYLHQGQICMATGRILAHRSIAAELVEKLAEKARHLPVGNPAVDEVALAACRT